MERPVCTMRDDVSHIKIEKHTFFNVFPQGTRTGHCSRPFPTVQAVKKRSDTDPA